MPRLVLRLIAAGTVTIRATAMNAPTAATLSTVEDLQVRIRRFKLLLRAGEPRHRIEDS